MTWEPVYVGDLQSEVVDNKSYHPIPLTVLPETLEYTALCCRATSATARPTWRLAFTALLSIPIDDGAVFSADVHRFEVLMNRWQLFLIPRHIPSYQLSLDVPFWIRDLSIEIRGSDQASLGFSSSEVAAYTKYFTAGDLIDGKLIVIHGLGAIPTAITVWNDSIEAVLPDGVKVLNVNSIEVDLSAYQVNNTWLISLEA